MPHIQLPAAVSDKLKALLAIAAAVYRESGSKLAREGYVASTNGLAER